MKRLRGVTSFQPPPRLLHGDCFRGATLRHTYRPEGTRDWLLIYTLGGSGLYRFAGGEFRSRAHDITLFRPGAFQDYQIAPDAPKWDLLFAHFLPRPDWVPWMSWPEKAPGFMVLTVKEPATRRRITQGLRDTNRLNAGSQHRSQVFAQNAFEEVLLWCDAVNPNQATSQIDQRVRKAMDFLGEHASEPFSEDRLAHAAGLSSSRLRHLFRTQVGDSPRRFQEELRLRRARDLLAMSRQTIGEIARELGFENPFYFTLRFKKQTGESPRAFRQRIIKR